jgi:hypothetical protein
MNQAFQVRGALAFERKQPASQRALQDAALYVGEEIAGRHCGPVAALQGQRTVGHARSLCGSARRVAARRRLITLDDACAGPGESNRIVRSVPPAPNEERRSAAEES